MTVHDVIHWYVCRSGVRLRSLGSRHTHLKLLVSEQSSTRQRYKDLLAVESSSSQLLHKWSQAEENPALQDVLHQVHDLNAMWVQAQREFVGEEVARVGLLRKVDGFCTVVALKEYKRVYENVLAVEKKLDTAKKHLVCRLTD